MSGFLCIISLGAFFFFGLWFKLHLDSDYPMGDSVDHTSATV